MIVTKGRPAWEPIIITVETEAEGRVLLEMLEEHTLVDRDFHAVEKHYEYLGEMAAWSTVANAMTGLANLRTRLRERFSRAFDG